MTEGNGPDGEEREEVGSVADEAAKLFGALQDWAREAGRDHAGTASAAASGMADSLKNAGDHIGHSQDCKYCPICQAINVVRETSPEVKQHLAVAASSLLQAAQGLLATPGTDQQRARRDAPVEKIDLDDNGAWDDD